MRVWFVTERGFAPQASEIMRQAETSVSLKLIHAGKLRRYHGVPLWRQLLQLPTVLRNARDVFLLALGSIESIAFLLKTRPDVVFMKGGFVCVPVGLAARLLRIPLVIHDSDTQAGLSNRILSRWARLIATGAPLEHYSYPKDCSSYTGIPVNPAYGPVSVDEQAELKHKLGYDPDLPLLLVTGGGLGAKQINDAVVGCAAELTKTMQVVHLTGAKHIDEAKNRVGSLSRYDVIAFADRTMPELVRAADVVLTRAGATTLLELAASAKPVIIVPHPHLVGNHQVTNAAAYADKKAAIVLSESEINRESELLPRTVQRLIDNLNERHQLSKAITHFAKPRAAADVAGLIRRAAFEKRAGEGRT